MAEKIIKAIVLNAIEFQEYDKIITVYSDKYGKISFIALGVNKPESKNAYSLNTFAYSEFQIFKSRGSNSLSKLKTGVLIKNNVDIARIYNNYLFASALTSIILQDDAYFSKNYRLFLMLRSCVENINKNSNPFSNFVWFLFFNLKILGGEWNLNRCYICRQKAKFYRKFDFRSYGLVCLNCFDFANDQAQDPEFIKFLMNSSKSNFSSMVNNMLNVAFEIILSKLLLTYITDELGIKSAAIDEILTKEIYNDSTFAEYTHSVLTKTNN